MKTLTYQEFLNGLNLISESEYNKMLSELPDLNFNNNLRYNLSDYDIGDFDNVDEIAGYFILNNMPRNWGFYGLDMFRKRISLNYWGNTSLKNLNTAISELEELTNIFKAKGFTVSNYEIIKSNLEQDPNDLRRLKMYISSLTEVEKENMLNLLKVELHDEQT